MEAQFAFAVAVHVTRRTICESAVLALDACGLHLALVADAGSSGGRVAFHADKKIAILDWVMFSDTVEQFGIGNSKWVHRPKV